jgi:hypothetical protein
MGVAIARTQGAPIVVLSARPRTPQRGVQRGRAAQPLFRQTLLTPCECVGERGAAPDREPMVIATITTSDMPVDPRPYAGETRATTAGIGSILGRASGCGGTGRRDGFRSRWASRPLEVQVLSPALMYLRRACATAYATPDAIPTQMAATLLMRIAAQTVIPGSSKFAARSPRPSPSTG